MKIAIGQIGTDADKTANFALVAQAVITAAMNHARLILFPEATMRAFGTGRLDQIAEPLDGPFVSALAGLAKNYNIAIVTTRSEERRVGKECRSRWSPYH